jgi:hypothetical protein
MDQCKKNFTSLFHNTAKERKCRYLSIEKFVGYPTSVLSRQDIV